MVTKGEEYMIANFMPQLGLNKETNNAKIKNLISNTPKSLSKMVESIIFSK